MYFLNGKLIKNLVLKIIHIYAMRSKEELLSLAKIEIRLLLCLNLINTLVS
ncbi:hypothetical protein SAMN04487910_4261 [Aquimarina amphilecti]|uniref:Uncharacterized protein n=1 Tax=Aquimarina amphilecti TaxID=1038014 RepID=A0A1H7VY35_AQUAM|nr:hypothetical protein SAMN04487910_4261 [Aquimarina amphilecti]